MHLGANILLAIAALLTAWLGFSYLLPLPAGPDRAMIGLGCFFIQTPRWICLAIVLGLCVARGAFSWPGDRAAQYLLIFTTHLLLGLGAICAGLAGLGMTAGVSTAMARILALATVLVPAIQIAFAAWFLNPSLHSNLDPEGLRRMTNIALLVFAGTVLFFGAAGARAYQLKCAYETERRAAFDADEKTREAQKAEAENKQFRALTPEAPLIDWILFLQSTTSQEHADVVRAAILQRPSLVADLRELISSRDARHAYEAMRFVSESRQPPVETVESVRERAREVVAIAHSIDPNDVNSRTLLYGKVGDLADGVRRAAWGLFRAGADLRPELRAISDACGPREKDYPHEISDECDAMIKFIGDMEKEAKVGR